MRNCTLFVAAWIICTPVLGQGQDSNPWSRDQQVILTMLEGTFSNSNQAYFDRRIDRPIKHDSMTVIAYPVSALSYRVDVVVGDQRTEQLWVFQPDDDARAVRMTATDVAVSNGPQCDLLWRREAAQFRAEADGQCENSSLPLRVMLADRAIWLQRGADADFYALDRARAFSCYVDIPGVGGGRDIPYKRYDDFELHDQGGSFWFESDDGRSLGVSMLLVDWPINNLEGIFTRNSLVLYINERTDDGQQELAYTFTVPEADRIGINLKWMLVNCFMQSNEDATPSM
ncbi:MAG: hypothetical protein AAGJ86_00330 [Pseudomonadota bacterium]